MWLDGRSVILEQGRVLARRGTVRHKSILERNETREERFAGPAREKEREREREILCDPAIANGGIFARARSSMDSRERERERYGKNLA